MNEFKPSNHEKINKKSYGLLQPSLGASFTVGIFIGHVDFFRSICSLLRCRSDRIALEIASCLSFPYCLFPSNHHLRLPASSTPFQFLYLLKTTISCLHRPNLQRLPITCTTKSTTSNSLSSDQTVTLLGCQNRFIRSTTMEQLRFSNLRMKNRLKSGR